MHRNEKVHDLHSHGDEKSRHKLSAICNGTVQYLSWLRGARRDPRSGLCIKHDHDDDEKSRALRTDWLTMSGEVR